MPALTRFEELPLAAGQAVGVLGGSFDPPHEGHLHISHEALRRFGLDRLVWLVSPGNPLKRDAPAPMAQRMARARELVDHPRIDVSDFEARHGTRFTAETLERLRHVHRGVRFVWIMGADNLVQFHWWDNWQGILRSVPVGVLARPGQRLAARSSVAARAWRDARLPEHASHLLPLCQAPAWCFVNVPMREVSSTEIRARGGWPAPGGTQA